MNSGRKLRVMVACVTFETVKVSDPVEFYTADKVYLIHRTAPKHPVYQEFYDRTVEIISRSNRKIEIVEVDRAVWDFSEMLRTVVGIIDWEIEHTVECEIFVNISAGSPEYTAAAAIGSMMYKDDIVKTIAVAGKQYTVQSDEDVRRSYFEREEETGRLVPVGLTKSTKPPVQIQRIHIKRPEEPLVRGLRIYDRHARMPDGRYRKVTAPTIIEDLKAEGLWKHNVDPADSVKVKNEKSSNAVYFHRDFIERWLKHNYIKRDDFDKKYILTDEGQRVIEIFYTGDNCGNKVPDPESEE